MFSAKHEYADTICSSKNIDVGESHPIVPVSPSTAVSNVVPTARIDLEGFLFSLIQRESLNWIRLSLTRCSRYRLFEPMVNTRIAILPNLGCCRSSDVNEVEGYRGSAFPSGRNIYSEVLNAQMSGSLAERHINLLLHEFPLFFSGLGGYQRSPSSILLRFGLLLDLRQRIFELPLVFLQRRSCGVSGTLRGDYGPFILMSRGNHFLPLACSDIAVVNRGSNSKNFCNRFRALPIGMTILGFILYGYGYGRCKFGTDDSWLHPLMFIFGIILYITGLCLS